MLSGRHQPLPSVVAFLAALLLVACGASAPTASPEASASPTATSRSATATATPTPRTLASLAPDEAWRAILELVSGSGGRDEGAFDVRSRYRVRYDCIGQGNIVIRVGSRVVARRDCRDVEPAEPKVVRGVDAPRLRARVSADGDVEWVVRFEVPR